MPARGPEVYDMNKPVAVDCLFDPDGRVRVRRVQIDDQWLPVEQGRQWYDENGRHVLIMRPDDEVQEILLSPRSLQWELVPRRTASQVI